MSYQRVLAMKLWAWTRSPGERRGLGAEPDEPFCLKGWLEEDTPTQEKPKKDLEM